MPNLPLIASVYIQHKTRSLGHPFDYRVPERFAGDIVIGSVVLVPLGKQKTLGIVAGLSAESKIAGSRLVDIAQLVDYPPISESLIRLALWVSDYYYCSPATALGLVLPPGGLPTLVKAGSGKEASYTLKAPAIKPRRIKVARLIEGVINREVAGAGESADKTEGRNKEGSARQEKTKVKGGRPAISEAGVRVMQTLAAEGELPLAELTRLAGVSASPVKTLAERGLVEILEREVRRDGLRYYGAQEASNGFGNISPGISSGSVDSAGSNRDLESPGNGVIINRDSESAGNAVIGNRDTEVAGNRAASAASIPGSKTHTLNIAQQQALDAIVTRLDAGAGSRRSRPILLAGVAGAGKTEVYLCAIEAAVARGHQAIVLVPEISLTHQAVKRFRRRFGDRVGVLHSGLSAGERYDEFSRIRAGDVDVVIGPRSALFSPLPDLGIIVIDEENDGSFKQENDPRYDARRVALERARIQGAVLVYGSATPSLESYQLVRDRFSLPERATGAQMPQVEIVDMRDEKDAIFSRRLVDELSSNLAARGKTILLLNSRGYARFLQCGSCGQVWQCTNCEVSLTIHSRIHKLLCHHCGHMEEMPDICPECGSTELRRWGVGTEQLEDEVRRRFPEAPVFRLDADTARGYGAGPRILEEFGQAEGGILLGTQMVAKGHHFPEVTLAAVVNADLSLQFPEFRAEEQTFSLLLQLSGRSGRSEWPGRVVIQTWNADIECIRMAAEQALDEFYAAELERRRRLAYPPFVHLVNIICLSRQSDKSSKAVEHLKGKLEPALTSESLLGPADLFRLKGWSRSHVLLKTDSVERTLAAIKPVIEHFREPYGNRGVRIVVDVDPQWLS